MNSALSRSGCLPVAPSTSTSYPATAAIGWHRSRRQADKHCAELVLNFGSEAWSRQRRTNLAAAALPGRNPSGSPMPMGPSAWTVRGRDIAPAGAMDASDGQGLLSPSELLGKTANVKFHLKYKTSFGQGVKLLGSHPKLGSWNLKNSVELRWTAGDQWVATVPLPAGGVYEYKYVLIDYETKQALEWQSGSNAVLAVVVSETDVDVFDNWGNAPGAMVQVDEDTMTRETKLQKWATEMMGYWKEARRLQIELVQKNNESQGLRNELAQLRMELSLERQNKLETEAHITSLQVENAGLKAQLVQKTVELNNTLAEVLQLLDKELEEDMDGSDGYYDEYESEDQLEHNQEEEEEEDDDDEEPPSAPLHARYVNGFADMLRNNPPLAARTAPMRNSSR